jgi:hypothetical protein
VGWSDTPRLLGSRCALRLGWQTLEWFSRAYALTDRRIIKITGAR